MTRELHFKSIGLSWGAVTGKLPRPRLPFRVARMIATAKLMGYDIGPCEHDHLCEGMHVRIDGDIYLVADVSADRSCAKLMEVGPHAG